MPATRSGPSTWAAAWPWETWTTTAGSTRSFSPRTSRWPTFKTEPTKSATGLRFNSKACVRTVTLSGRGSRWSQGDGGGSSSAVAAATSRAAIPGFTSGWEMRRDRAARDPLAVGAGAVYKGLPADRAYLLREGVPEVKPLRGWERDPDDRAGRIGPRSAIEWAAVEGSRRPTRFQSSLTSEMSILVRTDDLVASAS